MEKFEQLMQQQREFTKSLLEQQQRFMQTIVESNRPPNNAPSQQMVPAFPPFKKELQNWDSYLEQLNQHFSAYAVSSSEKKKSFFLSWIGTEVFELLKNLFGTPNLNAQQFETLTEKLTVHFKVSHHLVAARYDFFKNNMKQNQSYKDWVADLRGLARECKFVCNSNTCSASFVDDMIRDHIIVHTPHDAVRAAALQKQQASLADVLLIAESFEATTKTVAAIKECVSEKQVEINAIGNNSPAHLNKNKDKYKSCAYCFVSHKRENCRFKKAVCNKCGKRGHIAVVCMSDKTNSANYHNNREKRNTQQNNNVDIVDTVYEVTGVVSNTKTKSFIKLKIFNIIVDFQMDSGATVSLINFKTYELLSKPQLVKTKRLLYAYGVRKMQILGELHTSVKCGDREENVVLIVVNSNEIGDNLFGHDLFDKFGFEIKQINEISSEYENKINELCLKYKDIFEPTLGTIKNIKANIRLKPDATPKFFKSRQIPFAQMEKFKNEIDRLIDQGVLKPVKFSEWASPIVLAQKPNNGIRVCGDFKMAVNTQIDVEQYPLPTREHLFHKIRNGKYFSTIDLKDAYLQIELDDESKLLMVINTPLGLFQYQRLPYGIASAPAIFQKFVEQLLTGIEGCGNYLDDIIISAPTLSEHMERLEKVLQILKDNGIKCKQQKCQFLQNKITYLGCQISKEGILPDESGVHAVKNLKPPTDVKEIEAFMGKVNYYHSFVPNFSTLAAPINMLRRKNVPFKWESQQQQAFDTLKAHIVNATQLAHFQDQLPLVLATDASPFGLGAVISHIYPDGTEKPIAFASKTLDKHQEKYSQIEKEGLAIIFGVKRFHQYLYGRKFILLTDHKPLVSIFNPNKHLPTMTANRLQRWAITLMAYQYEIKFRKTADHGNADALSRLPIEGDENFDKYEACFNINFDNFPLNVEQIRKHSKDDEILSQVRYFIEKGWPEHLNPQSSVLKPFFNRRNSLTIQNDLICLQTEFSRIIIPNALKQQTLKLLHDGHWGVVKMKQLARQHIWWNNIDNDITEVASKCDICKNENQSPPKDYQSWPKATKPWERVHIDFAGPIFGTMWLICVDSFSQFPYVSFMSQTTTDSTIAALSAIFAIEGIPDTLVSDNGPQLTSDLFKKFCTTFSIKHITTAPFHPASNGLAERFVRTFKTSVRKNIQDNMSVKNAVQKFLATYRILPNAEGKSPAELIRGRPIRTIWSQLLETPKKQQTNSPDPKYSIDQPVYIRNYAKGRKWIPGIIKQKAGKMMFVINAEIGVCRRHINQIKPRIATNIQQDNSNKTANDYMYLPTLLQQHTTTVEVQPRDKNSSTLRTPEVQRRDNNLPPFRSQSGQAAEDAPTESQPEQVLRRSTRPRRGVSRYSPDIFRRN